METQFPTPRDDDAEDVAWGLTTGGALWRQGERYDAIVWLKRAVESANEAGASDRADELNRATTELMALLANTSAERSRSPLPSTPKVTTRQPPSPPPMRKASPVAPRSPPTSKPKLSSSQGTFGSAVSPDSGGGRDPMPSVTTSAPTLEALTHSTPAPADEARRDPPPPPTIVPRFPSSAPTQRLPASGPSSKREARPAPSPSLVAALDAVAELTADQRRDLGETASLERLAAEEDVTITGLALVIEGRAGAQATVADVSAVALKEGEFLYARSSIPDSLSLRLVAESDPTTIATWDASIADEVLASTPEFLERLRRVSDRIQAIAGCTMGAVGERLDEGLRSVAIDKLVVRVLQPNDLMAEAGQPVPGMVIVGVGSVELVSANGKSERLGPGDFLFPTEVLSGGTAPTTARAGAKGAIVLFGGRAVAHELLVTCPPLLEVLAGL